jgi:hypothetical protein
MEPLMTLAPLIERNSDDLEAVAQKVGEKLARSSETGDVQCCIYEEGKKTYYGLKLGEGKAQLRTSEIAQPRFEIITRKETALRMAEGTLSPLAAFYDGQMRIRGDIELGKRLLTHLGNPKGRMETCK